MRRAARQVFRSAAFYPVTGMYVAAVAVFALVVAGTLRFDVGCALLAVVALFLILASVQREVDDFHRRVAHERWECLSRIDQLAHVLQRHGIPIPPAMDDDLHRLREEAARDERKADHGEA